MTDNNSNTAAQCKPSISLPLNPSPLSCWKELASSLNAVKSLERFSSMEKYPLSVNPVIQVQGHVITLPLIEDGAEKIKQAVKNTNVTDEAQITTLTSDERIWNLDADNFQLLNPEWPSFLKMVLDDACKSLGITEFVHAKLYELLLCEQDGFYQSQGGARETSGTAAILAIYLPSTHQGGEIRLSYGKKRRTFNVSESSMFTTRALTWFSNATYEEEKIVSGRRLVLIYRIVDESTRGNLPSHIGQPIEIVGRALHQCIQQAPNFSAKIYLLDHHYQRGDLILHKLQGHDRAVGEALNELCARHGLHFLLGRLVMQRTILGDSAVVDNQEESPFSVKLLNGADGAELAKNVVFTKDQLINGPYRSGRVAGTSPSLTGPVFRGVAAIICPTIHLASYLYPPQDANFSNIIQMVIRDINDKPNSHGHRGDSCRVLWEMVDSGHFLKLPPGICSRILQWAWRERCKSLFGKVISLEIGVRVDPESMAAVAQIINTDALEDGDKIDIEWDRYFGGVFCHTQDLKNATLNLEIVQNKIRDILKLSFTAWKKKVQQHIFRNKSSLSLEDIDYFLHSVMPAKKSPDWVLNCLIPALRAQDRRSLLRRSICLLLDEPKNTSLANARDMAKKILLCTYRKAALETLDFDSKEYIFSLAKNFGNMISSCLHAGLKTEVIMLLDASWTNIAPQHANPDASPLIKCQANIKEFLHDLGGLLQNHGFPHISSMKEIFKLLIRRYIYAAAPSYPEKLPGWKHKLRGCGCETCLELDAFLGSDDLVKGEFVVENGDHLKSRVPNGVFKIVHRISDKREGLRVYWIFKIKGKEFQHDMDFYNEQVLEFEKYFEALRNDYIKGLIGEKDYRELIMLENVENSEGQKQLRAADAAVKKKKRKADDSDSDDDDKPAKKKLA